RLQCSHCGTFAALHRIGEPHLRFCLPKFTFISGQVLSVLSSPLRLALKILLGAQDQPGPLYS
ncbi:hypothetical protein, partial [Massilia sp.]|uniref:hypothetical protein n=1 Tax=Massilia sp. TaxID=1882437 RepID=UPI0028AB378D